MSAKDYSETLCAVTAALAIKLMVNKLLSARARIGSSSSTMQNDIDFFKSPAGYLFKCSLLAFPSFPGTSKDDMVSLAG
jgi:hypothetical protein